MVKYQLTEVGLDTLCFHSRTHQQRDFPRRQNPLKGQLTLSSQENNSNLVEKTLLNHHCNTKLSMKTREEQMKNTAMMNQEELKKEQQLKTKCQKTLKRQERQLD